MNEKKRWADTMFCEHGISYSQECDYCEIAGLQESLKTLYRKIATREKRLDYLQIKIEIEKEALRK